MNPIYAHIYICTTIASSKSAALGRSERQRLLPDVVEDVHVLLLVVPERAHRAVRLVPHGQAPHAGPRDHVAVRGEHHVGAVEVERHARQHGRRRRRRGRQREAQVEPRGVRPVDRWQRRDQGLYRGADLLVRRVGQRGDGRAGVDDEAARAVGLEGECAGRDGQRLRAQGYARQVEVVVGAHGRPGRASDERRGADAGAVERRRRAEEEGAGAVGVLERRQAVGEPAGAELRDERQAAPAQPHQPRRAVPVAAAGVAAAEGDAGDAGLVGGGRAEGEGLGALHARRPPGAVRLVVHAGAPGRRRGPRQRPRAHAQGAVAREHAERGRARWVVQRRRLLEALGAAGRALRPDEVAARVGDGRVRQRRRADGQRHEVLPAVGQVLAGARGHRGAPVGLRELAVAVAAERSGPLPVHVAAQRVAHELGRGGVRVGVDAREPNADAGGTGRKRCADHQEDEHGERRHL
uniref:Uncharacterized protein n=1 Tax=Zea mays TaxID=4577 RepID=B7ZYW9_MAIZE|nr:unknown [Zea mays]